MGGTSSGKSRTSTALIVLALAAASACGHEERRVLVQPQAVQARSSPPPATWAQYLVAEPMTGHGGAEIVPLGTKGVHGVVVDKRRIVVGQGEPRIAADVTSEPIVGASQLPRRFGGGFLFWTANTLYRADAFDAKLVPLVQVPDPVYGLSFAPKSVMVRTKNGERWGIGLPNGERVPVAPLGLADVAALDDGRALAFSDQGAVFTSLDAGAHWADATAQVKSSPTKVAIIDGELWLVESNAGASRLEPDGRLAWFDKAPSDIAPELRPKDPRWRGSDPPLRAVFRSGASIDDATAIVLEGGDVVRVDVRTGEALSIVPGRLPPDAQCETVSVSGDVLFACISGSNSGSAFVVAHTLSAEAPIVEQILTGGSQFYASDDGGLAYDGACRGVAPQAASHPTVCVRMPSGAWEERDVSGLSVDGGAGDVNVARWVPRADGRVVALVVAPSLGIYDPASGSFQAIAEEARDVIGRGVSSVRSRGGKLSSIVRYKRRATSAGSEIVDTSWSFASGGALRGWQRHGESLEISEDGKLGRSPYSFDVAFSGPLGLGRSKDGRLYQSNDHGASWVEVATPPGGGEALELIACTSAGCDLGAFYRVGWSLHPPHFAPEGVPAPAAPEVRRVRGLELSCRPSGPVTSKLLARTESSSEDLGLGVNRLPVTTDKNDWLYVRNTVSRSIVSPMHAPRTTDGDSGIPSLRALFSGFGTTRNDGDIITASGPNKNVLALRRGVSYVPPFDPFGRVVRTAIAMSDVVAAGRRAGMESHEVLSEDFTESGAVIPLASLDPFGVSDIAIHNVDHGLLTVMRGERVRVAIRNAKNSANVVSGVLLGNGDEAAFLEVDETGVGHVFKVNAGGVADLFDVNPTANDTYYPANPDALAVSAKGDLAIVRTPSGSDPPSALDPALLLVPAMPPTALAPWSALKLADDPACKAEQGGHRAVIQTQGPWIRVTTPDLRVSDDPMIARVRWTASRVCLEGFEVKLPDANTRLSGIVNGEWVPFATWLVGKGSTFARVGVAEGLEWRQPLECSIVTTGP